MQANWIGKQIQTSKYFKMAYEKSISHGLCIPPCYNIQGTEKGLSEGDTRQISDMIPDAMALLADTSHSLVIQGRLNFKSQFKDEFSPVVAITPM